MQSRTHLQRGAPRLRRPLARSERSNAKPSPGSVGTTPAASTSLWAASRHYKQKTNAQQHERKRPQQASIKPGTWQTMRGPLHPLRGAAPVMWRCTRYVAIHPNRRGVMPTDRVHCPSEQVKVWSVWGTGWLLRLASIIADALQEYFCVIAAACGLVCRGRATGAAPVMGRCTRYVALHPLRGAAPEQKGCNAYGSGAAHPITRTNAESARRSPTNSHVNPLLRAWAAPPRCRLEGLRAQ